VLTDERFKERRILSLRALHILLRITVVSPASNIQQFLVEFAILHVFGADESITSASVNNIVKRNRSCCAGLGLPCGGYRPRSGTWCRGRVKAIEFERENFGLFKDLGTTFGGVTEH
jgi:hypothetical protein